MLLPLLALIASGLVGVPQATASHDTAQVAFFDPAAGKWSMDGIGEFYYGVPGDSPLLCDWDGDGTDTVGLYRSETGFLYLRQHNSFGVADISIFFGIPEDLPVCGDWDGDGVDTIGVYRPSTATFYLRNSNQMGFAERQFVFGPGYGVPVAGDFNGDGKDTVGLWMPATSRYLLSLGNTSTISLDGYQGRAGDRVVVADFDRNGRDTIGAYRPGDGQLYLSDVGEQAGAPLVFDIGSPVGHPVAGATGGTPPSPARPVNGIVGPGLAGVGLTNLVVKDNLYASSFTAPQTGTITGIRRYMMWEGTGYGAGDGGILEVSIRPADSAVPIREESRAGPSPSTVLGSVTLNAPRTAWMQQSYSGGAGVLFTFDSPVPVVAGQEYWMVGRNLHSDPWNNFVSFNDLRFGSGPKATDYVLNSWGSGWYVWREAVAPKTRNIPLYEVVYSDGTTHGNGYIHGMPHDQHKRTIEGANRVRQVGSFAGTIGDVFLFVGKSSGTLQLSVDGAAPVTGVELSEGAWNPQLVPPVVGTTDESIRTWVRFTLPAPVANPTSFEFSSSGRFVALPLRKGGDAGYASFGAGHAEWSSDGGSSWQLWSDWGWPSTQMDLMWYATLQ